jgi:acyl-CoA carboxylase subunit beta
MAILETGLDPRAPSYIDDQSAMRRMLARVDAAVARACEGGGEKQVTRHHARGKLLPRERIELLVDRDSAVLELSTLAAYGTGQPLGAGVVTVIAIIADRPCVIVASDPTVRGGAWNAYTARKVARAVEIALVNGLPMVTLAESDGPDAAADSELLLGGGATLREQARLRAAGVPTVCAVFGLVSGITLPAFADQIILVRGQARMHLSGPHLVREITGEAVDDEALGGALLHATRTGLGHQLAEDERDALRLVRQAIQRLCPRPQPVRLPVVEPRLDGEDLLAVASGEEPFDPREILGRVLDGSEFDEVAPLYGDGLCTGFGSVHGYRIGVLASVWPALGVHEVSKAIRFVRLAAAARVPLLFLPNTGGFALGTDHEAGGLSVYAAQLVEAVATSSSPMITIAVGGVHGPAVQALGGRSMRPRFLFSWPNASTAMLPAAQTPAVSARGPAGDEASAGQLPSAEPLTAEASALHQSGQVHDDGVIDPRDTRTVLGVCLSVLPAVASDRGRAA